MKSPLLRAILLICGLYLVKSAMAASCRISFEIKSVVLLAICIFKPQIILVKILSLISIL